MTNEPTRVERIVAALVYEYQREHNVAWNNRRSKRRRPTLLQPVDLSQFEGLTDKQVARQIRVGGSVWPDLTAVADRVADERAGEYGPPADRCQAGLKAWFGLQCQRLRLPDEQWCGHHHPDPPARDLPSPRVGQWDLKARPDGEVLAALYGLHDRMERLEASVAAVLERLQWEQEYARTDGPAVLNTAQAAEMLGISRGHLYRLCRQHLVPFSRLGNLYRFSPTELQDWLARKSLPAVR